MAQLSSDSFAFGGGLMTLDEALVRFREKVQPVEGVETVPLAAAAGRVLAVPLVSSQAVPGFDNSAVDGYAVRHADLGPNGARLKLSGRVIAGAAAMALLPGEAIRIFTGAPLPEGADTVYMQEDVRVEDGAVILPPGLARGANARFIGEDIALHAEAIPAGRRLRPEDIALAAALGAGALSVRRRLRVAFLSTGNELADAGAALSDAALFDTNRPMLTALAMRAGCEVFDRGIVRDDEDALAAALASAAAGTDVIVTTGGVSTGEEDHVKAAIERVGTLDWWRIGIKPGRPVAMGVISGVAVLGLPGNPVAAYVTFTQIVRPLLAALSGESWRRPVAMPVIAGFSYRKKVGRREFVRVSLDRRGDALVAMKYPQDGAGVITSLTRSDGLVELPEGVTSVEPGDSVGFLAFSTID